MSNTLATLPATEQATYWEKIAGTKWGTYVTEIEKRALLMATELAGEPTVALDIGCEGGRWSMLLADLGWNIICTDIDPTNLAICQRRIPQANCLLVGSDDSCIPCETDSLGLLLCLEVFKVIHADCFIDESSRVLTPSGILVGVVQNRFSHRALAHRFISKLNLTRRRQHLLPYLYKFSYRAWKKRLIQSGFRIVHEEGICWLPFGRSSNFFLIAQLIEMERRLGLRYLTTLSPWIVFVAQKSAANSIK